MAATLSTFASVALQRRSGSEALVAATAKNTRPSTFRTRGAQRGFVLRPSRSFRSLRTIKKSPRLSRSVSRFVRITTAATGGSQMDYFSAKEQEDDVSKPLRVGDEEEDAANANYSDQVIDTVNAVLADVVDSQKFIKETGRTKARPMKRRALVVCLALGAFRSPINDAEDLGNLRRSSSASRLARTPSSRFARTVHLLSQVSFGASPGASTSGSAVAGNNDRFGN